MLRDIVLETRDEGLGETSIALRTFIASQAGCAVCPLVPVDGLPATSLLISPHGILRHASPSFETISVIHYLSVRFLGVQKTCQALWPVRIQGKALCVFPRKHAGVNEGTGSAIGC